MTNTIDIAKAHLNARGSKFTVESGENLLGATWTALVVTIPDMPDMDTVRIWSDDTDVHIAVDHADAWGYPRGDARLDAHTPNPVLIAGIIDAVIAATVAGR